MISVGDKIATLRALSLTALLIAYRGMISHAWRKFGNFSYRAHSKVELRQSFQLAIDSELDACSSLLFGANIMY